jgi:hypothetical protein
VGDVVLAIGNPFGVGQTVTMGIVSALGRTHLGINTFEDFIQTDAAINPGNSGGALVDAAGNLIGINSAIYSRTGGSLGIGFAIPVSLARNVMEQIIQTGAVTRGWIGVEVQAITPELAESFGLPSSEGTLISGVMRGSPADRSGVRPGDVLLSVDGRKVNDPQAMLEAIAALPRAARPVSSCAAARSSTSRSKSAAARRSLAATDAPHTRKRSRPKTGCERFRDGITTRYNSDVAAQHLQRYSAAVSSTSSFGVDLTRVAPRPRVFLWCAACRANHRRASSRRALRCLPPDPATWLVNTRARHRQR